MDNSNKKPVDWTDVFKQFEGIRNAEWKEFDKKYGDWSNAPQSLLDAAMNRINGRIAELYHKNEGNHAWDEAYRRWNEPADEAYEDDNRKKNDPKTQSSKNQDASSVTDDEISEALSDYTWEIGPKDTIGSYADSIAKKLNIPRERVSGIILKDAPRGSSEESNMQEAIDYWDQRVDRMERIGKIIDAYANYQTLVSGKKFDPSENDENVFKTINNIYGDMPLGMPFAYDEIVDVIRSRRKK